jgi:hypothetical protein
MGEADLVIQPCRLLYSRCQIASISLLDNWSLAWFKSRNRKSLDHTVTMVSLR